MRSPSTGMSWQCVLIRASSGRLPGPGWGTSTIAREGCRTPRSSSVRTIRSAAASSLTVTMRLRTEARACGSPFSVTSGSPPSSRCAGGSHREARYAAMVRTLVSRASQSGVARLACSPNCMRRLWTACSSVTAGSRKLMACATPDRRARGARRPRVAPRCRPRRSAADRLPRKPRHPGSAAGSATLARPRRRA